MFLDAVFVIIVLKTLYDKTIFFSDIQNNEGLGKCWPLAWLITLTLTFIIPDVTNPQYCLVIIVLVFFFFDNQLQQQMQQARKWQLSNSQSFQM